MEFQISGHQMSIGESLAQYIKSEMTEDIGKYFKGAVNATIIYNKEGNFYHVSISVNEGTGNKQTIVADNKADDAYIAFSGASKKIQKQLRRYKTRLKDHHPHNLHKMFA